MRFPRWTARVQPQIFIGKLNEKGKFRSHQKGGYLARSWAPAGISARIFHSEPASCTQLQMKRRGAFERGGEGLT